MSLYIRDASVKALAEQAMRVTKAHNLTEAVRMALTHEIERARLTLKPSEIGRQIREKYKDQYPNRLISTVEENKRFFDEQWGDD